MHDNGHPDALQDLRVPMECSFGAQDASLDVFMRFAIFWDFGVPTLGISMTTPPVCAVSVHARVV
jgi:hypothetical protein